MGRRASARPSLSPSFFELILASPSLLRMPQTVATLSDPTPSRPRRVLARLGQPLVAFLEYVGGLSWLLASSAGWVWRSVVLRRARLGRPAIYAEIVRL